MTQEKNQPIKLSNDEVAAGTLITSNVAELQAAAIRIEAALAVVGNMELSYQRQLCDKYKVGKGWVIRDWLTGLEYVGVEGAEDDSRVRN